MKDLDLIGLLVLTFLIGGLFSGLGFVIKTQSAADMINGFDPNKYDKEKSSKEVGTIFLVSGILIIFMGISGIFISEFYYNYIGYIQIGLVIISTIAMVYKLETKCKIKKKR